MKSIHNLKQYILKIQTGGVLQGGDLTPEEQYEMEKMKTRREVAKSLTGVNTDTTMMEADTAIAVGGASKALAMGFSAADTALMGNKNFDGQSQAIDNTVHGVSGALMQSGNPYAILAGGILEGVNFLTKAGGQTTEGYDVNIDNSGYGTLGHMESKSNRGWVSKSKLQQQLEYRNAQTRMALDAAEISADQQFEQEARRNSVSNTIMNNREALAGGYNTNTLGE